MSRYLQHLILILITCWSGVAHAVAIFEFKMAAPSFSDTTDDPLPDGSYPQFIVGGHIAVSNRIFNTGISISNQHNLGSPESTLGTQFGWWLPDGLLWVDFWYFGLDRIPSGQNLAAAKDSFRLFGDDGFRFIISDLKRYCAECIDDGSMDTGKSAWYLDLTANPNGLPSGRIELYFRTSEMSADFKIFLDGENSQIYFAQEGGGIGCFWGGACVAEGSLMRANRWLPVSEAPSLGIFLFGIGLLLAIPVVRGLALCRPSV